MTTVPLTFLKHHSPKFAYMCIFINKLIKILVYYDDLLDLLVDYNSNCALGDVKNATSFAVVDLVWHSFMDGTIYLDENYSIIHFMANVNA